jgi:hypothetical protein
LIESREELPKGQDHSPPVIAFNEGFGTSFRGELLSIRGEVLDLGDDAPKAPKFALLWTSPEFVGETGEGVPKKKSPLTGKKSSAVEKHFSAIEKHVSLSAQTISEPANEIPLRKLNPIGSYIFFHLFAL